MNSLDNHWPEILSAVRQYVPEQTFDTWFLPLQPLTSGNGSYRIGCPNSFFRDWFTEHHLKTLANAGLQYFGRSVAFTLEVTAPTDDLSRDLFRPDLIEPHAVPNAHIDNDPAVKGRPVDLPISRYNLNPDYTFDNFVVGENTDLAYAAATAVAKKPGGHYNPLFLHGGVGLGKTHLMHAIGNQILSHSPDKRVCYVTAEQFMSDLVFSIQQNRTPNFKFKYRNVDVLLVDDVAFLAGKESTQEEFFHTFNALYNLKKQIVLTSDRSPKEITTLEERLRNRFEWGLITDIQPPNLETRIAILRCKVETNNIYIADDVIHFVAENVTDNIRRLEGALIRLLAFASLTARDITLDMASEVLSSFIQSDSAGPIRIAEILDAVSDYSGFTVDQLKSKRRTQDLARYRQVAMFLAREMTGSSLNQIGRALGGRDHSTVSHACNKVKTLMEGEPQFRGMVKTITDRTRERQ
jgi:chromosomal replication initiator protein